MQPKRESCFIGFGSNLGNRKDNINKAIQYLRKNKKIKIKKISSIIETRPQGILTQPKFLNGVLKLETTLSPQLLLKILNKIEKKIGRVRRARFGPRIIDMDILLYGGQKVHDKNLKIPHPRMWKRRFVTIPLKEIAPEVFKLKHRSNEATTYGA